MNNSAAAAGLIAERVTLTRLPQMLMRTAWLEDAHFMLLVQSPISRSALSSLSTQILAACIRASDELIEPGPFNCHIAIWQVTLVPAAPDNVMETLKTRLQQMSFGTKRPVQFVDAASGDMDSDANEELAKRRGAVIAKIDAVGASPSARAVSKPKQPEK